MFFIELFWSFLYQMIRMIYQILISFFYDLWVSFHHIQLLHEGEQGLHVHLEAFSSQAEMLQISIGRKIRNILVFERMIEHQCSYKQMALERFYFQLQIFCFQYSRLVIPPMDIFEFDSCLYILLYPISLDLGRFIIIWYHRLSSII